MILPGVGAFPHGMDALVSRGLDGFLRDYVLRRKPFLGICLGMQMLMDFSTEFRRTEGLGFIAGGIDELRPPADSPDADRTFRLPNVGWSPVLKVDRAERLGKKLLDGIMPASKFYFVHSFCASADTEYAAAISSYEGSMFASIISIGNVAGTQFHPEKSGPEGLKMLKNFVL